MRGAASDHGEVLHYRRGCRCLKCRAAYASYNKETRERLRTSSADYFVSSELVLQHMNILRWKGVGLRTLAAETGISRDHLQDIRNGAKRVRQSTEERILRVRAIVRRPGARVLSERAHERVLKMLAEGWTKAEIGRAMGYSQGALKWWGQSHILQETDDRLTAVYTAFKQERKVG